ncbi:MAG TPA: alcohol dehydrogenase, partial [Limnochordia bacterium]
MKRLAVTGPGRVEVLEYEDRPLGDEEVLVRTEIASGKHGTAAAILEGVNFRGQRFDQSMRLFIDDPAAPAVSLSREKPWGVGTSGVGRVAAVGARVSRWRPGDRVFGLMDIRETNILHQDWLWPLGELDPLTALCIEPAYVAFHSVREANVRFGDQVAVIGLGAIGLMAVRIAREGGAEQVIAVDPIAR